jgi:hypothetical protein
MSLLPRKLPNRSSDWPLADGTNLLPLLQTSSLSAALIWPSGVEKPEPLRL